MWPCRDFRVKVGFSLRRSHVLLIALAFIAAVSLVACRGASGSSSKATPTGVPATATPEAPDLTVFTGFAWPLKGACLPTGDQLMPNAPRDYREGVHEGIDFYESDNCTTIKKGTEIFAAKAGTIVRIDHDYHPLTQAELDDADARIAAGHANDPDILDLFRGRQVWIDHGKGIVTRYAHTSDVPANLHVGDHVNAGDVIAFVGDSGTPESISNPDTEIHLHFELRAGDNFLGKGMPPDEVRALYTKLFAPVGGAAEATP
jgi:murein DD-endopeptidase MepM/ murein hydrolase activator NlpD